MDGLAERIHDRSSQLEELAGRLKEFEEGRQAVERRLEAAKHQIEVQEALGPQVCDHVTTSQSGVSDQFVSESDSLPSFLQGCSAKSLERLRSQQENLTSLQPQVVYLQDLAQGLVQDAPQTPRGGSSEGAQRLQKQARDTEQEFEDVTGKVRNSAPCRA